MTAFAVGAALLVVFVPVELRAVEPILPLWVVSRRLLCATTIVAFHSPMRYESHRRSITASTIEITEIRIIVR